MYDVVVVGAGAAGLQATLTLGRMHRRVLLLDAGPGRNGSVPHMHNFITHDGRSPEEFRAIARDELTSYDDVELRAVPARRISRDGDHFTVELADGDSVVSRRIILATGLRDELPPVPGLDDLWGTVVLQCPYCDGHELSGKRVAVIGDGSHAGRLAMLMGRFAEQLTVLTNGGDIREDDDDRMRDREMPQRHQRITEVVSEDVGVRVRFEDGVDLVVEAIMVAPRAHQAAPFAEQLGLEMLDDSCVSADLSGRTSVRGVFAAGDMAHCGKLPMMEASVLAAAAAGQLAATVCDLDQLSDETGVARVP